MNELPTWLWIPVVLLAALMQTIRNTAQRSLADQAGPVGASLARFLYGMPFALAAVIAIQFGSAAVTTANVFSLKYAAWLLVAALGHAGGSALLTAGMMRGNFVVAVTYSKTEILQIAVFSTLFLSEMPGRLSAIGIMLALLGVLLLSARAKATTMAGLQARQSAAITAAFGLGTGACYAIAAVGYRIAGLELLDSGVSPLATACWSVLLAQLVQSVTMGGWMAVRSPAALRAVFASRQLALATGSAGAFASLCWFFGYVLRPAADVRLLGMVEVVFSYFVSRRILNEETPMRERVAMLLVIAGAVCACLSADAAPIAR
ncbi:EamA family transporter [Lacisediminimonas profundi]|uniref:EamA family transporter n=1 Tax=Lacisediminimonas profundi TaxID=2603856 RepID=UPI00124BA7FE|nr:EamA family transporter [Lacisediminimonas profundi]